MAAWEALTPKQIASALGLSANLVRVRLHRARSRLKRQLGSERASVARRKDSARERSAPRQPWPAFDESEDDLTQWGRGDASELPHISSRR
jgi:hypothetical protein